MPTGSDFTGYLDAAITAFEIDDLDEARKQLTLAEIALPALPRVSSDGVSISFDQGRDALRAARRAINASDSGGVSLQGIEFHG